MKKYQVMLAKSGDKDILHRPSAFGFIFEPKFDGTRVLVYKDAEDIEVINRRGEDIISKYPELLEIPRSIRAQTCVLDAELVVLDKDGNPDPKLLQERERLVRKPGIDSGSHKNPATLFVFDILEKNNIILTEKTLSDRKTILKDTIVNSPFILLTPYTLDGKELWRQVQEQGIEGMIAKDLSSRYLQDKRTWSWLKIKNLNTVDALIAGITKVPDQKSKFKELILTAYTVLGEGPFYIGHVGDVDKDALRMLRRKIKKIATPATFLSEEEKEKAKLHDPHSEIIWFKPEMIAEVKYSELEKEKNLKDPEFLRLRFDKKPKHCILS